MLLIRSYARLLGKGLLGLPGLHGALPGLLDTLPGLPGPYLAYLALYLTVEHCTLPTPGTVRESTARYRLPCSGWEEGFDHDPEVNRLHLFWSIHGTLPGLSYSISAHWADISAHWAR